MDLAFIPELMAENTKENTASTKSMEQELTHGQIISNTKGHGKTASKTAKGCIFTLMAK